MSRYRPLTRRFFFPILLLFFLQTTVACSPKNFAGGETNPSKASDDSVPDDGDGQVPLLPGDEGSAQSLALTDLCVLTSLDYADGFANYAAIEGRDACAAYGLRIHELHYELYETEVRYLPRAQVESLVKQAAGVSTLTATTKISMSTFLNLVKTNTTPIAVHPTFY